MILFVISGSSLNDSKKKRLVTKKAGHRSKKSTTQQYSSSVVSDLFDGQLISSVQCLTCNTVSSRRETFQDLSLPIPSSEYHGNSPQQQQQQHQTVSNANEGWMWWMWQWVVSWVWGPAVTVHHCLNAFFSADELKGDNMYSCEKCGKLRNGLKYSKVVKLPEVLVVHLKRFRHDYMFSSKISQHVAYPLTGLNLQPFLHRDCVSDVRQYSLYGVICHHGSVGGGHYTAVAQNATNGEWYEFDDEIVSHISAESVLRSQAYVLFYKKTNPDASVIRSRLHNIMQVSMNQTSLMRFYISKQWYNKFLTFAECGPIDNSDFLCPHGGVQPRKTQFISSLVKVVRESVWEYLRQKYGGGPPCTGLDPCFICTAACRALQHRQQTELNTFSLIKSNKAVRVYGVAVSWFRQWENFVLDRTQQPPPAIDNTAVIKQYQQHRSSQLLRLPAPDYFSINGDCWQFFQSIYGGGPEFCLQQGYDLFDQQQSAKPSYKYFYQMGAEHQEEQLHRSEGNLYHGDRDPQESEELTHQNLSNERKDCDKSDTEPMELGQLYTDPVPLRQSGIHNDVQGTYSERRRFSSAGELNTLVGQQFIDHEEQTSDTESADKESNIPFTSLQTNKCEAPSTASDTIDVEAFNKVQLYKTPLVDYEEPACDAEELSTADCHQQVS